MTEFFTNVERYKNDILYIGYKNGKRVQQRIPFRPTLYLPTKNSTNLAGLDGRPIAPRDFRSMGDCNAFIKQNGEISNFLMYGLSNFPEQYIAQRFPDGCEDTFDRDVLNVTFIDIEVESDDGFPQPELAEKAVTAICVKNNIDNIYHVFGCGNYTEHRDDVKYHKADGEKNLLKEFLTFWVSNPPDILSGWNSHYFDIPYLVNRISKVLGYEWNEHLSPWGLPPDQRSFGNNDMNFEIPGIQSLDYLPLFKKLGYTYGTQESYKLDNIANVVLGEKKMDYSEYGSLFSLYKEDFQKFIEYNVKDVELVQRMEDKLQLLTLCLTLGYKANVCAGTSMGSVKIWDCYIYNVLKRINIIIPFVPRRDSDRSIEGAYVKEPIVGMHDWVVSFDLNSLYQSIIRQYNMSPDTIIDGVIDNVSVNTVVANEPFTVPDGQILCATGQTFNANQKGIFPAIVEKLYNERVKIKQKTLALKSEAQKVKGVERAKIMHEVASLDNNQMAIKIMLNSLYGAMSNKWFRYYDNRIAEGITITGQATIRWGENAINNYLNKVLKTENKDYVIAIDTDSLYVNFGGLVDHVYDGLADHTVITDFLDKVSKEKIEPLLENAYIDLQKKMNCPTNIMEMARECIASRAVWTGKKRYVMNVYDNEGVRYTEPQIKVTGLESVRSSTPQVCRKMIEETMSLILRENEKAVQDFILSARNEFQTLPAEDVAFPRGVNNVKQYSSRNEIYKKSTPMHVRAAILYNKMIQDRKLTKKYELIGDGDKMKFIYMKKPNPNQENVLAFPDILPPEFEFEKYVDYETQFLKAYLEPINSILDAVGWSSEERSTLEDFFS